jgi:hypothetical protein
MPHMVMFRSTDGKPGYHQADALEEAVRFVERLRNQENVTEARIFKMEEVPIEFRTYYKVEVAAASDEVAPATTAAVAEPEPSEHESGEPAVAGSGSRFSLRGKG